ncbi:hypothetical protein B0H12DRAFT_1128147 [Mycena haematopus]|nr:hypothetical protein B0H12DRAFT_1128147 [Mycena haematopus]
MVSVLTWALARIRAICPRLRSLIQKLARRECWCGSPAIQMLSPFPPVRAQLAIGRTSRPLGNVNFDQACGF